MSPQEVPPADRLAALRHSFDRSFAEAPATDVTTFDDLLAIRIGGDPYAVRLTDISGIFVDRPVTWLPGPLPELLGLTRLREAILPVYDLGALLGYPRAGQPRWLLVAAGAPAALAVDRCDGQVRVSHGSIAHGPPPGIHAGDAQEGVSIDELARTVIRIPSLLERIESLVRQRAPQKEQ